MASAGASGTVTVEDQRSYIEIETLRGKNPTEIQNALREVCGRHTVDHSTVSHWSTRFHDGRVTINDDQRPGRPKTSTDERNVKLVEDLLAQDRRVTCEEISQAAGISPTSVFRILKNYLQKRKICSRWVTHCLTAE
jgi:transposase